ncbi:E3 ubiquitin-protein ligase pub1 [Mycoemilia scoparia]|uniref:E3 ubiquitin-protein ligase pub1 n=1 Tax=Mycoemilia scoparia TaxID=417184 RepID=A0A9W8DWT9_9FUNG|nr:E3 ubiquitin-protein ligase pub1 [Mycoemilia scoparia]
MDGNASTSDSAPLYANQQIAGAGPGQLVQLQQPQNPTGKAEDPNCKSLYVGNLDPRVTEQMLFEIFATVASVLSVKIIPDKHLVHGGMNYGFVELADHQLAQQALQSLNGRRIIDSEIRVNWAFAGSNQSREDTSSHHHIFVGDLSPEVNDAILAKAFSAFSSMSDARVMWDVNSGKSRGYGFVAFRERGDAENAIGVMNGEWLGNRAIRVNWANQKNPASRPQGKTPVSLSYEAVLTQTSEFNTTVYVGNLSPNTTQEQIIPMFLQFGYVIEVRMQTDRGYAFIKLNSHEAAAMAITSLQGQVINDRAIKVSWGKDRAPEKNAGMFQQNAAMNPHYAHPYPYGMPQHYPGMPGNQSAPNGNAPSAWGTYSYDPQSFYNPLYQQSGQGMVPNPMPPTTDPSTESKNGILHNGY